MQFSSNSKFILPFPKWFSFENLEEKSLAISELELSKEPAQFKLVLVAPKDSGARLH